MLQKIKNKFATLYSLFKRGLKYQINNGSVKALNKVFKKINFACCGYFYESPNFGNAIFTKGLDVKRDIQTLLRTMTNFFMICQLKNF